MIDWPDSESASRGRESLRAIQDYYGRVLGGSKDLKTDACCSSDRLAPHLQAILSEMDPEIIEKFYGCGSPIPDALEGCTVLDMGCGTGRDAFLCAHLVGERGQVIGLDMTDEQLAVANRHVEPESRRFGFGTPNIRFAKGYMEDLRAVGIDDASVDVVISNCVINLAPDKQRVFREIFRVLRPGGELYFSDIFADRRLPDAWRDDPVLLGECLAGAMYLEDFRRLLLGLGVPDVRVVTERRIDIDNAEIEAKVGGVEFHSVTFRAFKLESLEDRCEDYGQVATYLGTIPHRPHRLPLDDHHVFTAGKPMLVCGNTAAMIEETRLGRHFRIEGDRSRHFGLFPCGPERANPAEGDSAGGCC
jgi:SAM-dependent methyltransferase